LHRARAGVLQRHAQAGAEGRRRHRLRGGQRGRKMEENKESLANLRTNLAEYGLKLEEIPWVIQYNKRDLPEVYTVEQLDAELNPERDVQTFEAVATQ